MARPTFDWPGLRLVLGLCMLFWAVIGAVYVYIAEPQWRYQERRVSSETDTAEVIYFAFKCLEKDCSMRRCPQFAERTETEKGGSFYIKLEPMNLALPAGLPSPEDTDLAVDGNYFFMTGYRYQGQETNLLTGATRETSPPRGPRFDVIAWEVKAPYSAVSKGNTSGESTVRENVLDDVRYEMPGTDHGSHQFTALDALSCVPPESRRREG